MDRVFILIVSLFFLFSCAPPKIPHVHKKVYIDQAFSPDQKQEIIKGLYSWRSETHSIISFQIMDSSIFSNIENDTLLIRKVTHDHQLIVVEDKKRTTQITVGLYVPQPSPQILIVNDRIKLHEYRSIILHELGHAFKLHHSDSKNSIMFKTIDEGSKSITKEDLKEFCKIYDC